MTGRISHHSDFIAGDHLTDLFTYIYHAGQLSYKYVPIAINVQILGLGDLLTNIMSGNLLL
jgi:hypothetical protein